MSAYYNENDPKAAAWLRELIKQGHIAQGEVDERSIEDITPADLRGYTQYHFFAGIGVWSYALRLAGWPDSRPVWTGSCPCQPYSQAGKGGGDDDERHLWPAWFHLIDIFRPGVVFGEQVASKAGLGWLDLVQADLEGTGYACGAIDLCAAGVGAPHIRQRLYFVGERLADSTSYGRDQQKHPGAVVRKTEEKPKHEQKFVSDNAMYRGAVGRLGNTSSTGSWWNPRAVPGQEEEGEGEREPSRNISDEFESAGADSRPGPTNGFWADADWLFCRDRKWRPVIASSVEMASGLAPGMVQGGDSGLQVFSPLSKGEEARVMRLRGYGNALTAPVATAFICAYLETQG